MPSWIETKQEITRRNNDYDGVRRERIRAVEALTGRPLIVYATAFLSRDKVQTSSGEVVIDGRDKQGFDEVTANIDGDSLDVLLHSPGGDPQAAESIVELLRSRFSSLRFIIPDQAKSAATMMCCAGDEILMDERSELGPIDPQMLLTRGDGVLIRAPAQAILDQFDRAKDSLSKNPDHLPAWLPILQPLGPSLLTECEAADQLARELVTSWLKRYMLSGRADAADLAGQAAEYLADSKRHLSHGRRIGLRQMKELGLAVQDMKDTPQLQAAIWELYQAIVWTLDDTNAFKIIENGRGEAFIRQVIIHQISMPAEGKPLRRQQPGGPAGQAKAKRKRKR